MRARCSTSTPPEAVTLLAPVGRFRPLNVDTGASCRRGVIVAKHGNRAASSRSGAAGCTRLAGVKIGCARWGRAMPWRSWDRLHKAPPTTPRCVTSIPTRTELGTRTIFPICLDALQSGWRQTSARRFSPPRKQTDGEILNFDRNASGWPVSTASTRSPHGADQSGPTQKRRCAFRNLEAPTFPARRRLR